MRHEASQAEAQYPRRTYAWGVVVALALTAVLSYTDRQVMSLLVDPIKAALHIDDTKMSLLLGTAFAMIYGIVGLPMGWFADHLSRRNLILIGIAVWSLGTIGCGLAHTFGQLCSARVIVGMGEAALSPAAISLISDLFPAEQRGRAVGVFFTGICIGIGGSFLIGGMVLSLVHKGLFAFGFLAHSSPWRIVFWVIGGPGLLWCLALLFVREPVRHGQTEPAARPTPRPAVDHLSLLRAGPIFATVALASLVDNGVGAWLPSLLVRRFNENAASVGLHLGYLLIFAYGGGMLAGGALSDLAARLRGSRGKIELCALASLLITLAAPVFASSHPLSVMIATGVYFMLSAVVTASGLSAILDATPNSLRGRAMAVSFFLSVAIGAGFGPTAIALSSSHLFGAAAGLGPAIALIAGSAFALAIVTSIWAERIHTHHANRIATIQ
jgi:MFS family permease